MIEASSLQSNKQIDLYGSRIRQFNHTGDEVGCSMVIGGPNRLYWLDGIASSIVDIWGLDRLHREQSVSYTEQDKNLLVTALGWTITQTIETRVRLLAFEEDWDAPGMERYDDM